MKKQILRGSSGMPGRITSARIATRQLKYSSLAIFLAGETAIVAGTLVFFFNRRSGSAIIFIGLACATLFFLIFTILIYYYARGMWVGALVGERKECGEFIRDTIVRLDDACEQLQKADRLKTEFVAVVSHELRAPLAAIQTGLDTLTTLRQDGGSHDEIQLLEVVGKGVCRLSHLVNDLMDITRIDTGKLELEIEPADASDMVARVVALCQGNFIEKGLVLKVERPDGPCPLRCDPLRVEQVLTNLVDNALKFTREGEVIIRLEHTPDRVICSVSDTGPGISPELHQKVFEKFYSSSSMANDGQQGIGLGLAISWGIIETHGGSMWIKNHDNSGVTFTFDLPREPG